MRENAKKVNFLDNFFSFQQWRKKKKYMAQMGKLCKKTAFEMEIDF